MAPGDPGAAPEFVEVEVVFSPRARQVLSKTVSLPAGATVAQALEASGLVPAAEAGGGMALQVGVWGRKVPPETPLRPGDRIEIYRPLTVDPKEARRLRYRGQGEKLPKGIHRPKDGRVDMTAAPANRKTTGRGS